MSDNSVYTSGITDPLLVEHQHRDGKNAAQMLRDSTFGELSVRLWGTCQPNSGHLGYLYEYWQACGLSKVHSAEPAWGKGSEGHANGSGTIQGGDVGRLGSIDLPSLARSARTTNKLAEAMGRAKIAGDHLGRSVDEAWHGKASEAATDAIGKLAAPTADYADALTQVAAYLQGFHDTAKRAVQQVCDAECTDFMVWYGTEGVFNVGDWSSKVDALLFFGGKPGIFGNSEFGDRLLLDRFAHDYATMVGYLRRLLRAVSDSIDGSARRLEHFANHHQQTLKEPFEDLAFASNGHASPGGADDHVAPRRSTAGGGPHVPGGGGSGIPESVAGAGSQVPSSAGVSMPNIPAGTISPESASVPSMPGPSQVTPSTPDVPAGSTTPASASGGLGTTAGIPGTSDILDSSQRPIGQTHPESVTVQRGEGSITMTSPDGQGRMTLTVDGGKGGPKSYAVDFGDGAHTGGAALPGALGGGAGAAGATGHQTGQNDGQDANQNGAVRHIEAGEDGKAVIHDGDETITVERAGDGSDEVTVTVEDGNGEPTTYTMDYSEQSDATAHASASANAGAGVGGSANAAGSAGGGVVGEAISAGGAVGGLGGHDVGGIAEHGDVPGEMPGDGPAARAGQSETLQPGAQAAAAPQAGGPGVASAGVPHAAGAGEPGVATAPGSTSEGGHGGAMGMPMMGGMGAGAGQGGNAERGASPWQTTGNLFDDVGTVDENTGFRTVSGVLGENR